MSSYADRQKAYRQRCRAGRCIFRVEADEVALEELLIASALLPAEQRDDRDAVEAALGKLLDTLIADHHAAVSRYT